MERTLITDRCALALEKAAEHLLFPSPFWLLFVAMTKSDKRKRIIKLLQH